MTKGQKIGLITFGVFMTEAIIHYNVGIHKNSEDKKFVFPPTSDLIKLGAIVGIFSLINGVLIDKLTT
jgi:hypothetical protein